MTVNEMIVLVLAIVGFIATSIGTAAGLGWWLNGQFMSQNDLIMSVKEDLNRQLTDTKDSIDDKILYHERLDDARFNEMRERFSGMELAIMKIELRDQRVGKISGPNEI